MNWWDSGLRKPKPGTGTSDMIPRANNWYNLFTRTTDLVHMHHFAVALHSEAVTNQYSTLLIKVDVWDHRYSLCVSHIVISITSLKQYNVTKSGCPAAVLSRARLSVYWGRVRGAALGTPAPLPANLHWVTRLRHSEFLRRSRSQFRLLLDTRDPDILHWAARGCTITVPTPITMNKSYGL